MVINDDQTLESCQAKYLTVCSAVMRPNSGHTLDIRLLRTRMP
jgi:hypothetical protein